MILIIRASRWFRILAALPIRERSMAGHFTNSVNVPVDRSRLASTRYSLVSASPFTFVYGIPAGIKPNASVVRCGQVWSNHCKKMVQFRSRSRNPS